MAFVFGLMNTAQSPSSVQSYSRQWAIATLALTLVIRGGVLLVTPGVFTTDPDGYRLLATNLVEHGTFGYGDAPTAYRPPLYPLLLVPCVALGDWSWVAIGLVHLTVGLATVWLTYRLGRRWGLGSYSFVAAVLVACDPILLNQSTLVMTETLAALLAVVGLLLLTAAAETPSPTRAMAASGALGLAVLCRPTFLIWAGLATLVMPWFATTGPQRLKVFGALVATVALVVAPWGIRNQLQFGRPIISTTHGGFTLLLGNNPSFYAYLHSGAWGSIWDADRFNADWAARAPFGSPAIELANDRRAYDEAWQHIADQPGTFLHACLVRVGRMWQPLPHRTNPAETPTARALRYAVGLWYLGELALAALGLVGLVWNRKSHEQAPLFRWERSRKAWLWGLLLVLSFTAVHMLYWTNMRMRAPLMPVVALAAGAAIGQLAERGYRPNSLQNKQLDI